MSTSPTPKLLRVTIVRLKIPFLTRLLAIFNGELVLGIMGTVQDVAVLSRSDAQEIMDSEYTKKWVPYQESNGGPSAPMRGPRIDLPHS